MKPKQAEWNEVIEVGDGTCGVCRGTGQDPSTWRDSRCMDCEGSGECRHCAGKGVRDGWHCGRCRTTGYLNAHKIYYESVGQYTPIQEVLDAISEETMAESIGKDLDALLESFPLDGVTVSSVEEYKAVLSRYNQYMRSNCILWPSNSCSLTSDIDGGTSFIWDTLSGAYADLCGAYRAAASGEAGGLVSQIDLVATTFRQQCIRSHREFILKYFKWEAKDRLLGAYIEAYGEHLPRKWQDRTPQALSDYLIDILVWHATVLEPALRAEVER